MRTVTICSPDGELIADRVTVAQRFRLQGLNEEGRAPATDESGDPVYNLRMIRKHKVQDRLYIALVASSIIRSELLRDISPTPRIVAQACKTIKRVRRAAANGEPVGYYEHDSKQSSNYGGPPE